MIPYHYSLQFPENSNKKLMFIIIKTPLIVIQLNVMRRSNSRNKTSFSAYPKLPKRTPIFCHKSLEDYIALSVLTDGNAMVLIESIILFAAVLADDV